MIAAWQQLGLELHHDAQACTLQITGCNGRLGHSSAELHIGNSGTSIRFLTAALATCTGEFILDGVARMRERPIGDLLAALRMLGGDVSSLNSAHPDCPPVLIRAAGLQGGKAQVRGNISSQFLSALMMAAPLARQPVELAVDGTLVSWPYVKMTAAVMRSFGAEPSGGPPDAFRIPAQGYQAVPFAIEPDASAASYFWGAAAITGGRATVEGLSAESLQGDVAFVKVLEKMGCAVRYERRGITVQGGPLKGVDVDMSDISDTVQTLAAVALYAQGTTRVTGVAHNRVKETDRIGDLATELRKLGAKVSEFEDGLEIQPPQQIQAATMETYDDHRMAMSLALVGLRTPGIRIDNPACTAKTYPGYWEDLQRFTGSNVH